MKNHEDLKARCEKIKKTYPDTVDIMNGVLLTLSEYPLFRAAIPRSKEEPQDTALPNRANVWESFVNSLPPIRQLLS